MSITNSDMQSNYDGDGTTKTFNTEFYFIKDSDVVVSLKTATATDLLTRGLHYSVTGAKVLTGGSITMVTAPAVGEELIIRRTVAYTQEDIYVENSAFPAKTLERSLDKVVMMVQQVVDAEERQITIPDTDDITVSMLLPNAETRAGLFPCFDDDGSIIVSSIGGVTNVVESFGDGLDVVGTNLFVDGLFTRDHQLKGDALVYRLSDTGASGKEWGIRSEGGNIEFVENTGTDSVPIWTVRQTITTAGLHDSKFKCSANDTTEGYGEDKVIGAHGITVTTYNESGNEQLLIEHDGTVAVSDDDASRGTLSEKLVAGYRMNFTTLVDGVGAETFSIACTTVQPPIPLNVTFDIAEDTASKSYNTWYDIGEFYVFIPAYYATMYAYVYLASSDASNSPTATLRFNIDGTTAYSNEISQAGETLTSYLVTMLLESAVKDTLVKFNVQGKCSKANLAGNFKLSATCGNGMSWMV
jgi:hypothetical protein